MLRFVLILAFLCYSPSVFFTLKYSRVCSHLFGALIFISSADTTMPALLKLLSGC